MNAMNRQTFCYINYSWIARIQIESRIVYRVGPDFYTQLLTIIFHMPVLQTQF